MRLTHSQSYERGHFRLDSLCWGILRWIDAKMLIFVGWKPAQRRKMHKIANFCDFLVHLLVIFVTKFHSNCILANTKMFVQALATRYKSKTRQKFTTRVTSIGSNVKNYEKITFFGAFCVVTRSVTRRYALYHFFIA